jgi:hypothetical protein
MKHIFPFDRPLRAHTFGDEGFVVYPLPPPPPSYSASYTTLKPSAFPTDTPS